jgi:ribonuclease P protein component
MEKMLKKKNRLEKKEFDKVFQNGEKKFSKSFMFIKLINDEKIKISATISKKIYKKAIERNKSRRIIYKILQENFTLIEKDF